MRMRYLEERIEFIYAYEVPGGADRVKLARARPPHNWPFVIDLQCLDSLRHMTHAGHMLCVMPLSHTHNEVMLVRA
jgi:hypothetical protein